MRDDFSSRTREKLAQRAGYLCSKPGCRRPTRGAASDEESVIDLGEAAHITAASPGGPRYDPALTSDQRKHHVNGIWLCGTDAKLVDSDESHFTVDKLRAWKRDAENASFSALSSGTTLLKADALSAGNVSSAMDLLSEMAKADLATFLRMPSWPPQAIDLNLELVNGKVLQAFDVTGLASAIETFDEIVMIAQPGTGKTTTLLQLAGAVLDQRSSVPAFIPLSEWSTRTDTFLDSLLRRRSFRDANIQHLELLAQHGKMLLIMDGWNELDEVSRKRARTDIRELQRNFPDIRLIISSRHAEFDLPISGPVVELGLLSEKQQLELATSLRGAEGPRVLDHAWRTPGLRELVAIPLYLAVLMKQTSSDLLPNTKEALLRSCVTEHEADPDKFAILKQELQGLHRSFLAGVGSEATRLDTTTLSDSQARTAINRVQEILKSQNQIAQLFEPMKVLDVLASSHLLVKVGGGSGGISFQHQQFQEWYASLWVEDLILSAQSGDASAKMTLRASVLDLPIWEEPILFACERLSRADKNGAQAVVGVVLDALGIDPLLSAEIIYRSSEDVWADVKILVVDFAKKWHVEKRVDRAVQFMINTGRAEFAEYVWPLVSSPDDQVHLRALRAGRRFRPNVLGPNVEQLITSLTEELRAHILAGIASESGMDGIELATNLAKGDPSPRVKSAVAQSLQFRRADRFVADLLGSAPDEVWVSLAEQWHDDEFFDPKVSQRIQHEADKLFRAQTDPAQAIERLLSWRGRDFETGRKIGKLLENVDFSDGKRENGWTVQRAYEAYPNDVVNALVAQLEAGKPLPFLPDDLLRASDVERDEGPIARRVLESAQKNDGAETAASIVGPKTLGKLIGNLIGLDVQIAVAEGDARRKLGEEQHRLSDLVANSKSNAFALAIIERSETQNVRTIALLADLIARHGRNIEKALILEKTIHARLTNAVKKWGETLLASKEASRAQQAEIPQAAERLRSPELVQVLDRLLADDLARQKKGREDLAVARAEGRRIENDAQMCWTTQYRRAFAAIGDVQTVELMKAYLRRKDFGEDAACVLASIWKSGLPREDEREFLKPWPDFTTVREQFMKRQSEAVGETFPFVEDILVVVEELCGLDTLEAQRHAINLAKVAFSMPYSGKGSVISKLIALPRPAAEKRDLLTILTLSGELIPVVAVQQGIDELLEAAKTSSWLLQEQDGWRLNGWLKLFPFTDQPAAVLDVLKRLEDRFKTPWNLRELLSALGNSPSDDADKVLGELSRMDERFLANHDWLGALTKRGTIVAARTLLELICSGPSLQKVKGLENRGVARSLAAFLRSSDEFREEVYAAYPAVSAEPGRSIIEYAIAEAADTKGILLLVRIAAAQGREFKHTLLYAALRNALIGRCPSATWVGSQELHGMPAATLRKSLFDLVVNGTSEELRLASACLVVIDEIRDDYGYVDSEPRHPSIATGIPWPQL